MKKYCFFSSVGRKDREVIMYRQAKSLMTDGFEVINVVSDNKPTEVCHGVRIIPSGYTAFQGKQFIKRTFVAPYKLYKKIKEEDADVYHTVHIDQLPICLLLKHKGKKVIFEMQESHPYTLSWKSNKPRWILNIAIWFLSKWFGLILKRLDAVIALNQDMVDYLTSWGIASNRIHLFGNFPEVNKEYSLTLEDYTKRENRVIYFGIAYSYSRQEIFLKALSKVKGVKYLVAGCFLGNENNSYKPKIMNMKEWKDVEYIEGFKHEELAEFIKRSTISNVLRDFSVFPKTKNGSLGIIKIFESMESALPIICSDVPVYRDIMKEYKCGILVDPNNEEQIREAIEYLVSHKEEAWRMGQEGRRAVIEKYSWDALSVKYLEIVNQLVNDMPHE